MPGVSKGCQMVPKDLSIHHPLGFELAPRMEGAGTLICLKVWMFFAMDSTYSKSSSNQDLRNIVGAFSSNHSKWVATSKYYGTSNSGNSTCCSTSESQKGWCVEESPIYIPHVNETNFANLGRYWMQASITSDFLNVQFNLETITDSTVASFTSCMITSTIFPKKSLTSKWMKNSQWFSPEIRWKCWLLMFFVPHFKA